MARFPSSSATPLLFSAGARLAPRHRRSRYVVSEPRTIAHLLALSHFCVAAAGALAAVPTTRLIEDALCRIDYGAPAAAQGPPEDMCKKESIQSNLAWYIGGIAALQAMIQVIVAFPYGMLADKIGRRPVFILSMIGQVLSVAWTVTILSFPRIFPAQFVLLSPLMLLVGGGEGVLFAMTYSMAADHTSSSDRSKAFLLMSVATYIGRSTAAAAASKFMETWSPWVSLTLSLVTFSLASIPSIFIPDMAAPMPANDLTVEYIDLRREFGIGSSNLERARQLISVPVAKIVVSLSILSRWSAFTVLSAFLLVAPVTLGTGSFIVQYASLRFEITLAQAGYLRSLNGALNTAVLLIFLPSINALLPSRSLPVANRTPRRDLVMARLSLLCLSIGTFLISMPSFSVLVVGLVIVTLGDGLAPFCRSIMLGYVDNHHASKLFTLISMVETVGACIAGPGFAFLFSKGMAYDGFWEGLPYIVLSMLCTLVGLLFMFTRLDSIRM